ncbi:MAG: magnesium transporter CorA family protein [Leptospiraceae bacterium]|nr:magnesium transporter CorA family protein [Leptospiraceae bacterium]
MITGSWIMTSKSKEEIQYTSSIIVPKYSKTWIHLTPRNEDELVLALRNFNIHPLTIEDMLNPNSRVKKEQFPAYTFVLFRGLHFESNLIYPKNFNFIITKNTLITVTLDSRNTINDIIDDWHRNKVIIESGLEFIIHRIIDAETDHFLPIVYRIEDQAEELESQVFSQDKKLDINLIFMMRGNLQQIKKITHQHIEILKEMETSEEDFISVESDAFFRDVRDHSLRILEIAEDVKEMISSALEVHLTISSRKSNEIMTMLTVFTAIMLPMSLITGLYGMNFEHIPFLREKSGFFYVLGTMGFIGCSMYIYFKLRRWF